MAAKHKGPAAPEPRIHASAHTAPPSPDVNAGSRGTPVQAPVPGGGKTDYVAAYKTSAGRIGNGASNVASSGGAVFFIFVAAAFILFMADKNGQSVNLERAYVGGFFVALILVAISNKAPGLALAFAALILVEVALTYGPTALQNFGHFGTTQNATPQIASTGATAGAAAALGATWIGAKAASTALGTGLGNLFSGNGGSSTTATNEGNTSEEGEPGGAAAEEGAATSEEGTLEGVLGDLGEL